MQQKQRHTNLHWQTPQLMKALADVNDALRVHTHEVDDLPGGESRQRGGTDHQCFTVQHRDNGSPHTDQDLEDLVIIVDRHEGHDEG